jgi:hypothetical protein
MSTRLPKWAPCRGGGSICRSLRARVEARLYRLLMRGITVQQKDQSLRLLLVPEGDRASLLEQLRSGLTRISGPTIRAAIDRLNAVRAMGITVPMQARIPPEPNRVSGALRQPRQSSGHQPHANRASDRDAAGLRPLSGRHRTGRGARSV